jgi:PAS domain S-box-containing protein
MGETLRILHIDENADDAALCAMVLRQARPDLVIAHAAEPVAFAEHLAAGGFAALIADYRLHWSPLERVLGAVRRRVPECAVLLFTAAPPEEVAGFLVEQRVDAYLRKDGSGYLALPGALGKALERASSRERAAAMSLPTAEVLQQLPVGVFSLSADGTLLCANAAARAILDLPAAADVRKVNLGEMIGGPERLDAASPLSARQSVEDLEVEVPRPDGASRWLRFDLEPARAEDAPAVFTGTVQDISGQKEMESRLLQRSEALRRSYKELEQLTYSVSHDLQEPLQLIARYTRLLREPSGGESDADQRRIVGVLADSAARMQEMVTGILEYYRLDAAAQSLRPVNMNQAAEEAMKNLQARAAEEGAVFEIEQPLPAVTADYRQMVQLFQNLIGNALKYRGSERPRIGISCTEGARDWLFAVRDNGIGIEAGAEERIFEMFQRLHTAEEYPGTGIGLAMCKRIVERHGGSIQVRSRPGEGSTFEFTIAKEPAGTVFPRSHDAN